MLAVGSQCVHHYRRHGCVIVLGDLQVLGGDIPFPLFEIEMSPLNTEKRAPSKSAIECREDQGVEIVWRRHGLIKRSRLL